MQGQFIRAAVPIVAIGSLLCLISFLTFSTSYQWQRTIVDFGHSPIFALITLALLRLFRTIDKRLIEEPRESRNYCLVSLAVLLIAFFSEAIQIADPVRSASVSDFLRNCAGGALALVTVAAFSRSPQRTGHTSTQVVYVSVIAALFFAIIAQPAYVSAAYVNKKVGWPTIIGNNYLLESVFYVDYASDLNVIEVAPKWRVNKHENAIHVNLQKTSHHSSGILVAEVEGNWNDFAMVCMEITNLGNRPLSLFLKFGNHPMFFRSTQFHQELLAIDGNSRVSKCVDLVVLPAYWYPEKGIALAQIKSLAILSGNENKSFDYLLHRIWLQ